MYGGGEEERQRGTLAKNTKRLKKLDNPSDGPGGGGGRGGGGGSPGLVTQCNKMCLFINLFFMYLFLLSCGPFSPIKTQKI